MGPPSLNGGNSAIWKTACYNASWRPLRAATQKAEAQPSSQDRFGRESQTLSLLGGLRAPPGKGPGT